MNKAKPFCIAKREVWEAYKQVKANRGAAGVDGQSIEDFERDLSNNLYRIWNRMSSGSYLPRVRRPYLESRGEDQAVHFILHLVHHHPALGYPLDTLTASID